MVNLNLADFRPVSSNQCTQTQTYVIFVNFLGGVVLFGFLLKLALQLQRVPMGWDLVRHEILAISSCSSDKTKSENRTDRDLHLERSSANSKEIINLKFKTSNFILPRKNQTSTTIALHNFLTTQKSLKEIAERLFNFPKVVKKYMKFSKMKGL